MRRGPSPGRPARCRCRSILLRHPRCQRWQRGVRGGRVRAPLHVIIAALAACAPRTRQTPDDTVVVLVDTQINTGDPRMTISNLDSKLAHLVCAGLTTIDT